MKEFKIKTKNSRDAKRFLNFEKIPLSERAKVKYVTMDMWDPYRDVVSKYLPNAKIAADPFHVIKQLNDGFNKLRVNIMNQSAYDSPTYYLLKKWHRLLDSDYNLDNEPHYNSYFKTNLNYRDIYNMLLETGDELKTAYNLKQKFKLFIEYGDVENCQEWLKSLAATFQEANLPCYEAFLVTLDNWQNELIASFERPYNDHKQSNALAENINGRLRKLINTSNGISNFERFRARAIFALNDRIFFTLTSKLHSFKRKGKDRGNYNKTK